MKYTIYELKQEMSNINIISRCYGKTGDNEFDNDPEFEAIGGANTVKEAKKVIEDLGGDTERF